ncbi:MAG: aminotransferase class V-fold PLP-dependent enzyme, partial [Ruminococcus sp.]
FTGVNSYAIATDLKNMGGVATRRGAFCAHTYVWRLLGVDEETRKSLINCYDWNTPGIIRVSFGVYNTEEEVDQFLEILDKVLPFTLANQDNFELGVIDTDYDSFA